MEKLLRIKIKINIYFFLGILISSCQPIEYEEIPHFHNYYPLQISSEKEFLVTDIIHNSFGKDTNTYFLKEVVAEQFLDLEGDTVYRIERFSKDDSNANYTIKDVWTAKKNHNRALLTEENEIFTKLIFPLNINVVWNGNAFNGQEYQEYVLESLNIPYEQNSLAFDSSLTVIQNYKLNLLQYESAKEVYVTDIGLVYKENIQVEFESGNTNNISQGFEFYQELISY